MHKMMQLFSNFGEIQWQMVVMWVIGGVLIYLAIRKEMEPTLLLPMGFGASSCQSALVGSHYAEIIQPVLRTWPVGRFV